MVEVSGLNWEWIRLKPVINRVFVGQGGINMIEKLPDLVNGDARLVWRGRFLTVDFLVEVGEVP